MLTVARASTDDGLTGAFAALSQQRIGALLVGTDSFFFMQRDRLVALAVRHAVPTMYFFREFVAAGGLISFGTVLSEGFRQLGVYTGKILNGAKTRPICRSSSCRKKSSWWSISGPQRHSA